MLLKPVTLKVDYCRASTEMLGSKGRGGSRQEGKHRQCVQPNVVHPETSARLLAHQASGYCRHVNHTMLGMLFAHQVYSIMPWSFAVDAD